jgi:hypothetical protein
LPGPRDYYHHNGEEDVIRLPVGEASVEAMRGFEFAPIHRNTGPVYCLIGDEKIGFRSDPQFFVAWIDKLIAMVEQRGRFSREDKKREVVTLFQKGRAYYDWVAAHGR